MKNESAVSISVIFCSTLSVQVSCNQICTNPNAIRQLPGTCTVLHTPCSLRIKLPLTKSCCCSLSLSQRIWLELDSCIRFWHGKMERGIEERNGHRGGKGKRWEEKDNGTIGGGEVERKQIRGRVEAAREEEEEEWGRDKGGREHVWLFHGFILMHRDRQENKLVALGG